MCRSPYSASFTSTTCPAARHAADMPITSARQCLLVFHLDRSNKGLLIPAGVWDVMENFTTGTVVLALASHQYEEEDYIRDFDRYCEYAREKFQLK